MPELHAPPEADPDADAAESDTPDSRPLTLVLHPPSTYISVSQRVRPPMHLLCLHMRGKREKRTLRDHQTSDFFPLPRSLDPLPRISIVASSSMQFLPFAAVGVYQPHALQCPVLVPLVFYAVPHE